MSGHKTGGAGQPIYFKCAKCCAHISHISLTGRERPVLRLRHALGQRMTKTSLEYRCGSCGHIGWSRHVELARKRA